MPQQSTNLDPWCGSFGASQVCHVHDGRPIGGSPTVNVSLEEGFPASAFVQGNCVPHHRVRSRVRNCPSRIRPNSIQHSPIPTTNATTERPIQIGALGAARLIQPASTNTQLVVVANVVVSTMPPKPRARQTTGTATP